MSEAATSDIQDSASRLERILRESDEFAAEMRRRTLQQSERMAREWPIWAYVVASVVVGGGLFAAGLAFGAALVRRCQ